MRRFLTVLSLLSCCAAPAQEQSVVRGDSLAVPVAGATSATVPANETLAAGVDSLRRTMSGWNRILARLPRISGYAQVGYEYAGPAEAGGNAVSSFFIKRVRLNLAGDITPRIDYRIQVEFASPKLVDAYLRLRPYNGLNFQIGEFKIPFSIENTDYVPLKFELIEYPLALRKLMGFNDLCGLSATGRDLGAQVYGGFVRRDGYNILNYNFGVFNGEGINTKDKNSSKDIVARLSVQPLGGWQFTGSYYRGEYGADCVRRVRYGAGMCYDRGRTVLRGEWIGGRTGELDSRGWYVLGGYRLLRSLQVVGRYDTFEQNVSRSDTRQTNYTAGLVWQPVKYLRCQLDYTYEQYASAAHCDRNGIALLLSGIF